LRVGLMIACREQFHQDGNEHRQQSQNKLRVQTCPLRYFVNQTVETFLAKKVLNLLNADPGLRKICHCLLNGGLPAVLLLLVQYILKVRSQYAKNGLKVLLPTLAERKRLSDIEQAA